MKRRRRRRLQTCEALESRELLAASYNPVQRTILITELSQVQVQLRGGGLDVLDMSVPRGTYNLVYSHDWHRNRDGDCEAFTCGPVRQVRYIGTAGDDRFALTRKLVADWRGDAGSPRDYVKVQLNGAAGDDTLIGGPLADTIQGGAGDDLIQGLDGADKLKGGSHSDTVLAGGGADTIHGNGGADELHGDWSWGSAWFPDSDSPEGDSIDGGGGNDQLFGDRLQYGTGGNDTLKGGANNDYLHVVFGENLLVGGGGSDQVLSTSDGRDRLYGDAGPDDRGSHDIKPGADVLSGGGGHDDLFGGPGRDTLYGGEGPDTAIGGNGHDLVFGGEGNDFVSGSRGHDTVYGDSGNDTVVGGVGHDDLRGGDGRDTLRGGTGLDGLIGGPGRDRLKGDQDPDRFVIHERGLRDNDSSSDTTDSGPGDVEVNLKFNAKGNHFTEADAERIDRLALKRLHRFTGNTKLLFTTTSGAYLEVDSTVAGGKFEAGLIKLSPAVLGSEDDTYFGHAIIHEFGHVHDYPSNGYFRRFRETSWSTEANEGWTRHYTVNEQGERVPTGLFYYLPAGFVSAYARRSPVEDWADSFAAFILREQAFEADSNNIRSEAKYRALDEFFASMR